MIYERDLDEAIAECQGERNPNVNTCIKLAAFLALKRELYGKPEVKQRAEHSYSYAVGPVDTIGHNVIDYKSDTDFSRAIDGMDSNNIWPVIDDMMTTVQTIYPRLYDAVMRQLKK